MAFVFFRNPEQARIAFQNVQCSIGRAAINDDMLDVRIILCSYTVERRFDRVNTVEARSDDCDLWSFCCHEIVMRLNERKPKPAPVPSGLAGSAQAG
jgi:hypothetical protein